MKVLMIGPARSVNGGISAVVNNYYKAGLDKGVELEYIGTMEDGSKGHKLKVAIKALVVFLMKISNYEVVHIHMASDSSLYRKIPFIWLTKVFKKKLVIQQHGGDIKNFYYSQCSRRRQQFIKNILNRADSFLVVASYLKDIFKDIVDEDKIIVFPNTIEIPTKEKTDYRGQNLLFLGRLCKEKGIRELLEVIKDLKQEFSDLHLFLGGVWVEEELKEKAKLYGEFVHYLGWIDREKKEEYLQKCNIFVLPTYFEGLPMSLLEGMAYGCACVATEVGGIPQVMTDRKDGLIIPPKDEIALKNAIRELLLNQDLQKEIGKNARKNVECNYKIDVSIDKLTKIYKHLCKK